jgi:hypothetical protein
VLSWRPILAADVVRFKDVDACVRYDVSVKVFNQSGATLRLRVEQPQSAFFTTDAPRGPISLAPGLAMRIRVSFSCQVCPPARPARQPCARAADGSTVLCVQSKDAAATHHDCILLVTEKGRIELPIYAFPPRADVRLSSNFSDLGTTVVGNSVATYVELRNEGKR